MAWSWNSSCNWRKLDNLPGMLYFTKSDYSPLWGNFPSLEFLGKDFTSFIYSILSSAVENFALHAADGSYHTLRSISFQICFRYARVCSPLALPCTSKTIIMHFIWHAFLLSCSKNITIRFSRRTDVMPPVPQETKHHPSAVDLLLIKRLIAETAKQSLLQFLQHEFVNLGKSYAERLIG